MITIAIVTFDSAAHLEPLFASLPGALAGRAARIVVFDNASVDGTVARVRELAPDAVVIESKTNVGYGAALNRILAEFGSTPYAICLNSDVTCPPGTIDALVTLLENNRDVAVAGPAHLARSFPDFWTVACDQLLLNRLWRGNPVRRRFLREDLAPLQVADVDWVVGAILAVRTEALRQVGGFDTTYRMYWEEADLSLRLRARGWRTSTAPAQVQHQDGGSSHAHRPLLDPHLWLSLIHI